MMILYTDANKNELYDFNTLQKILKMNKSKLYRELNKLSEIRDIKYKNKFLYQEKTLFKLMKLKLIERLEKMD